MKTVEIEREHGGLLAEKNGLVQEKMRLQAELSKLNAKVRGMGMLPRDTYREIQQRQVEVKERMGQIEVDMARVRGRLHEIATEQHVENRARRITNDGEGTTQSSIVAGPLLNEVRALITQYEGFSTDQTRVSSMRLMAAEFVRELRGVVEAHNQRIRVLNRSGK